MLHRLLLILSMNTDRFYYKTVQPSNLLMLSNLRKVYYNVDIDVADPCGRGGEIYSANRFPLKAFTAKDSLNCSRTVSVLKF